jgi:hypothetical protein
MIIPIEIGKNQHKALIANYLGSIIKLPFEFHNSKESVKFYKTGLLRYQRIKG